MTEIGIEPRRKPVQARSRERVDRILDAAAQLLTEEGYDAVKTNHIARRAGVSIGSIYQFFPNKYAIFHSLALRYMDRIADILSIHLVDSDLDRPWEAIVDDVIDTLAEMWRSEPAFLAVWMAIQNTAELREADKHYSRIFVDETLAAFLLRIVPNAAEERRKRIARIVFEVSQRLLDHSMHGGPEQDTGIIEEMKILVRSYLMSHVRMEQARDAGTAGPEA